MVNTTQPTPASTRTPDSSNPWRLIWLLWLTGILSSGQYVKVSVTFPHFREVYTGLGPSLGFLISALGVVGIVCGLFAGLLISRLGYRKLLFRALVLGGVMSLFQALLPPFEIMLISRFIEGFSHLVIVVAAPTMMAQLAPPEQRSNAMTLWSTIVTCTFVLFSWVGLPFVALAGLPAFLALHGVAMLAMAAYLSPRLPAVSRAEDQPALTLRGIWERHMTAYRDPRIIAPGVGWIFYAGGFIALLTVLPDYLPQAWRAVLVGIMPVAAMAVSVTFGIRLQRRFSPVTVLLIGLILALSISLLLLTELPRVGVAIAMLAVMGLVQSGSFSAVPYLNPDIEDQALSNGVMAQGGNFGNLAGTPLLLWCVAVGDLTGLVLFAVGTFGLGALCHLWLAYLRRRA